MSKRYEEAKAAYASLGVDTEAAIETLKNVPVSMHCWQGDDVVGFDNSMAASGGIQTTGNYPGKATTPAELMQDIEKAMSLIPGKKKLNLHASYAIFKPGQEKDWDEILPEDFEPWLAFAKKHDMGIDFNPTFFSHPKVKDGLTLSSPDEDIRQFWIEHGKRCIEISEYFAEETGIPCVMKIWIPDGYKNTPADRQGPRARFADSLDKILAIPYDTKKVRVCIESKVFGIGVESYTVGSAEFTTGYVMRNGLTPLMDMGHYHPTEVVSDKISSMLLFNDDLALHLTRSVRWDSDHVIMLEDEIKELAKEVVRCEALDRVYLATDFFDASINRIAAWAIGGRNVQKAFLLALLEPNKDLKALQDKNDFSHVMAKEEQLKTMPFGDVWAEYLERCGVPMDYMSVVDEYENTVLEARK